MSDAESHNSQFIPAGHRKNLVGFARIFREMGCQEGDALHGVVSGETQEVGDTRVRLRRCGGQVLWMLTSTLPPDDSLTEPPVVTHIGYTAKSAHEMPTENDTDLGPKIDNDMYGQVAYTLLCTDWDRIERSRGDQA